MKIIWISLSAFILLLVLFMGILLFSNNASEDSNMPINQYGKNTLPTYPAENISTTITSPRGSVTIEINTHVPESLAVMPVYRQNLSAFTDISVDRYELVRKYHRDTTNVSQIVTLLPDDSAALVLSEKYLFTYGGIPSDAIFEKTERSPDIHYFFPNTSSPYVRVYYNQSLSGFPVLWNTIYNDRNYDDNHVLQVDIGTDGELIGLVKKWPNVELVRVDPVISAEEAIKKLELRWNEYDSMSYRWSLNVSSIRQGYDLDPRISQFYEPCWIFSGYNQDGHREELSVLARRNDSITSHTNNYSQSEESITRPPFSRLDYYRSHTPTTERNIRITRAVDTVNAFSGNPELKIFSSEPVDEKGGKYGGIFLIYHINTSEGLYRVDASTGEIASIYYHQDVISVCNETLTFNQMIKKSCDFIGKKYGNCSTDYLASQAHIIEMPGKYNVIYPIQNRRIGLDIDNRSGNILNFYDHSAEYPIICC